MTFHWSNVTCIYCILNLSVFFPYKAFIYRICIILTFIHQIQSQFNIQCYLFPMNYWCYWWMDVSVMGLNNAFLILPMIYTVQENVYVIFLNVCGCVWIWERVRERETVDIWLSHECTHRTHVKVRCQLFSQLFVNKIKEIQLPGCFLQVSYSFHLLVHCLVLDGLKKHKCNII